MSKIICSICGSKSILFNNIPEFKEHVHTIHKCGGVTIGKLSFRCVQSFYRTLTSDNCNCKNTGIFTFTSILRHYQKMHNFGSPENNPLHEVISNTNEISINNDENLYDTENTSMDVDEMNANIEEATNEILNDLISTSGSAIEFARIQATYDFLIKSLNVLKKVTKCGFIDEFQKVLEPISTQYKREQYLMKKKVFIKPIVRYAVGDNLYPYHCFSMRERLVSFLSNKYVQKQLVLKMPKRTQARKYSCLDGNRAKNIIDRSKKTIFLNVFQDAMSPRGICSVSKGSFTMIYLRLANLDPIYGSQLNSIRMICTANSKIWKGTKFRYPLKLIVSEMNDLIDNGINICVDGNMENFAVRFLTFSSDNLELNQAMGFFTDFASRNTDTCRLCETTNTNFKNVFSEKDCILRNELRESVLNEIHGYNTLVPYLDVCHDILLGVVPNFIKIFFSRLVFYYKNLKLKPEPTKGYNSLQTLYSNLKYGNFQKPNKIGKIFRNYKDTKLFQSAMQSYSLLIFLPMVLNKLKNSCDPIEQILEFEEDERILTNVIRLTYLTMSSSIHDVEIKKIEDELVPSIIKYFRDKEDLKPKTHNMVHLGRAFRELGPLKNISAFRGEAFHVLCRNDVLRSKNKVEEAKTIARKNAYRECKMKLQDYGASAIKKYIPGKDDIIYLEKNGNSYGYNVIKVIDSDATKVHGFKLSLKHCYGSLFYFSITEEEDFYDCSTILSTECEYHIYKEKNCSNYNSDLLVIFNSYICL